jgi:hypothetical protein
MLDARSRAERASINPNANARAWHSSIGLTTNTPDNLRSCVAHLSCDLHDPFCIVVMSAMVMLVAAPPSAALPSRHDWFALLTLEVQSQPAKYICTVRPTKAEPGLPGFHIILRLD